MIRKIDTPELKAEGTIACFPYNTELVNIDGVWFHIWLGDTVASPEILKRLENAARRQRDVVKITYSNGSPQGFWAHENF